MRDERMTNKSHLPFNKIVQQQLNQIANQTVPQMAWFCLSLLILLTFALLAWSVMGTADINIEGRGIVLVKSGLFTIRTPSRKGIAQSYWSNPVISLNKGVWSQKSMMLKKKCC